jgi:hypothetical protein
MRGLFFRDGVLFFARREPEVRTEGPLSDIRHGRPINEHASLAAFYGLFGLSRGMVQLVR